MNTQQEKKGFKQSIRILFKKKESNLKLFRVLDNFLIFSFFLKYSDPINEKFYKAKMEFSKVIK